MSSSKRNRILLISNSELGQANVFLAVTHELLRLDPTLEIHLCSFPPFSKLLASFGSKAEIIFHELAGITWKDALFNRPEHRFQELCDLRPTVVCWFPNPPSFPGFWGSIKWRVWNRSTLLIRKVECRRGSKDDATSCMPMESRRALFNRTAGWKHRAKRRSRPSHCGQSDGASCYCMLQAKSKMDDTFPEYL